MNRLARLASILLIGAGLVLSAGTELSKAVRTGELDKVKASLESGEKVNDLDKWGWTPLMWAVYERQPEIAEFLLGKGADPNVIATDSNKSMAKGATALTISGYYGLDELAALLLNKGANRAIADGKGKKPIDYATQYEFAVVVELLNSKPGSIASVAKASLPKGLDASRLAKPFPVLLLEPFSTAPEFAKDYPEALGQCQANALRMLEARKGFDRVALKAADAAPAEGALVLRAVIRDMRIASGAARFWGGAMVGSSYVRVKLTLLDGASGAVLRDEVLSTENNAVGAAWSFGSTDRSIPGDMGAIIAGYVTAVAGKE